MNGKVFTADHACLYAQAVAISGKRISAVGTTNEIAATADTHTQRIDLGGRTAIPGINDSHFHHTPDPRATILPLNSMEPNWDEVGYFCPTLEKVKIASRRDELGS